MKIKSVLFAAVTAVALAGCEAPSPTLQAKPGQSAQQAVDTILQVRAIALVVGVGCQRQGITLRDKNIRAATTRDVLNLVKQGYRVEDLRRASERANRGDRLTKNAVRYLEARGVQQGNLASLCAYGKREIASRSAIGRLLKRT